MNKKRIFIFTASLAAVIATVFCVCYFGGVFRVKQIQPKKVVRISEMTEKADGIRLVAHRGLSGIAPENTVPAFEKAGKSGFYAIECDVHMTTDGKWVIMHDNDTKRMCEKKMKIEKSSFDELENLAIINGANIEKYKNLRIPTVEDYLKICVKYSVTPFIEIKNKDCSQQTIKTLYDTVYSVNGVHDAVFISFKKQAIESIKAIDKNALCYYLVTDMKKADVDYCKEKGFGINFKANSKKLEDETIRYAVSSGIETACWTVDKKEILNKMLSFGIKTVTTNRILPEE